MIALTIARTLLLLVEIALALPLFYLLLLAIGAGIASLRNTRMSPSAAPILSHTFALLVPAHNEELLIDKTLTSLGKLDYPHDHYTVHVIADNCIDKTAEIARAAGAYVHERTDAINRGKGHALAWVIGQLMRDQTQYDAYVVLDADTVVDAALLHAFSHGLANGGKALQAHNAVLNAAESATTALRWLALSLMNYIRPLGRNFWGGSSTLTGNGMCLTHELLIHHPWQAFGLSEDYQYYLNVVSSGERVLFVPQALVRSVMPTTARQLQSQDIRWETLSAGSGSWQRRTAWHLFADGMRLHSWGRLDALAEFLTPPLSVLIGGSALVVIAALVLATPVHLILAGVLVAALAVYVASPFIILRPPLGVYRGIVYAPAYIVRKLWIYFVLRRLRKNTNNWVRTTRAASASGENTP